ncbi:Rv0361 family membrane protein [Mycolicibacterium baixiangningiae]|uniref:Rv0361 family membrane protein n=1 Tax=Mycolicibacterium baixiangningiae TaxID=2761578 RepID=UPI0018680A1F|nr:hypothetical protein [Mycolicibacterium baixiangningiae]
MAGPYPYPEPYPQQPLPPQQGAPQPYPGPVPAAYPGMLPPPVQYPKRGRKRVLWALAAAVLVAALVGAVVFATRDSGPAQTSGPLSDASARTAIQGYLDALSNGDDEQIARHALCGLFDAVKEKRSDLALAGLAGDAFRKQFSRAEVSSIDTVVPWSANQAQVLFTMRVAPARGTSRGQEPPNEEEQAVAQLLIRDNEVLVCSYLLRTGSQY